MSAVATKPYVEIRNGGYYVLGTRISLDSVVYEFRGGRSPESIVESFPLLSLEQVYGAMAKPLFQRIAFYLSNRSDIDAYLTAEEEAFEAMSQPIQGKAPELYKKLMTAKKYVFKATQK